MKWIHTNQTQFIRTIGIRLANDLQKRLPVISLFTPNVPQELLMVYNKYTSKCL